MITQEIRLLMIYVVTYEHEIYVLMITQERIVITYKHKVMSL